ncbi:MAG: choice-of-anchor tandem repeat GloVer-containing protein [Candidatus Baltobacteraceae bacterium]
MRFLRNLVVACSSALLLAACNGGSAFNPASPLAGGRASPATAGYKQLYAFKGTPDGASPYSGLVAVGKTLYGTTLNGSSNYCGASCGGNECYLGCGTVFSVDSSGKEHVVYNLRGNFESAQDGSWPFAGLTSLGGALYGTASSAGAHSHGAVYTVNTSGQESVLYSFTGGSADGEAPEASLIAYRGNLYGTTVYGGGTGCGGAGCGTVYAVTPAGKESVLYAFTGGSDGARVYAGLAAVGGHLYGATLEGGQGCGSTGCGTIFDVNLHGKGRIIYRFSGGPNGAFPNGLVAVNGVLYGTTEGGGSKNSGTFFSITRGGTLTTLYSFLDIPDGNLPGANLIYSKGNFYGTTVGGGSKGIGTVFKVNKSGSETVLYSFQGGTDGSDPQGPVYLFGGNLYGTTTQGGNTGCNGSGCGTVYKLPE